jgi:hypothetical protein
VLLLADAADQNVGLKTDEEDPDHAVSVSAAVG